MNQEDVIFEAERLIAKYGKRAIEFAEQNTKDNSNNSREADFAFRVLSEVEKLLSDSNQ